MGLQYPPKMGEVLVCDFVKAEDNSLRGFVIPEMVKRRPVVVLSSTSYKLCIVAVLSATEPRPLRNWHYELTWTSPLPSPYDKEITCWVKGDHIYTVSYERLALFFAGKDAKGKRIYDKRYLLPEQLEEVKKAVNAALNWEV